MTITYDEAVELVAATLGNVDLAGLPAEQRKVKSFLNMALRRAYRASSFWPRYLVVGQKITPINGEIHATPADPATEDYREIDTLLNVSTVDQSKYGVGPSIPFTPSPNGYKTITGDYAPTELYCIYRATFPAKFGNNVGETSEIPSEFADYACAYAARAYQIASLTGNPNPSATIGAREVENILEDALTRIDDMGLVRSIGNFIQTTMTQSVDY